MQAAISKNIYYMPRVNHWKNLFAELQKSHGLPDYLDLVISTQDHPKIFKTPFNMDKAPLFVYTTTEDYAEIPLPNTEYFGRINQLLPSEVAAAKKWDGRAAKAVWRGSPTGMFSSCPFSLHMSSFFCQWRSCSSWPFMILCVRDYLVGKTLIEMVFRTTGSARACTFKICKVAPEPDTRAPARRRDVGLT